jgi:hypothetical protein
MSFEITFQQQRILRFKIAFPSRFSFHHDSQRPLGFKNLAHLNALAWSTERPRYARSDQRPHACRRRCPLLSRSVLFAAGRYGVYSLWREGNAAAQLDVRLGKHSLHQRHGLLIRHDRGFGAQD